MSIEIIESKEFDRIASLVEEVQNLHATFFPAVYKPYSYENIKEAMERMFADEQCRVFVAQLNGKAVAYMMVIIKEIQENAFLHASRIMHIDQIAVSGKHRESGVGSLLMKKAESFARQLSINRLELDHLHSNTVAAAFFNRRGYQPYRGKLYKTVND